MSRQRTDWLTQVRAFVYLFVALVMVGACAYGAVLFLANR